MSRTSTTAGTATQTGKPTQTAGATQPAPTQGGAAQEKVAARAYEKWLQKGCMHGNDRQDWLEAEAEIKSEMTRGNNTAATRR